MSEAALNKVEVSSLYSYAGEGVDMSQVGGHIAEPGYVNSMGVFKKTTD